MRKNSVIKGERLLLVPYAVEHVPQYHKWMQNEELLLLTCTEHFTLEEAYAMQRRWAEDDDKCTFIIFAKDREQTQMVGDVNLYLTNADDPLSAEIDVMIAEPSARRKGYAREAVGLMMRYALDEPALNLTSFIAKINDDNEASLSLFDRVGYLLHSHSEVFAQTTLKWTRATDSVAALTLATSHFETFYKHT